MPRRAPAATAEYSSASTIRTWRDVLSIHPAAEMFPMLPPDELKALGEDIKQNRLQTPITVLVTTKVIDGVRRAGDWEYALLDGRNRLDALELVGINLVRGKALRKGQHDCGLYLSLNIEDQCEPAIRFESPEDPWAYVISANIHRRHLTAELKRVLISKLLKAKPEQSNRQIATITKVDHKTVGTVRTEMEGRGEIPHVETRTDTHGRQQPAKKTTEISKAARARAIAALPPPTPASNGKAKVEKSGDAETAIVAIEQRARASTAEPRSRRASEKAPAEFRVAADIWFAKMTDDDQLKAVWYVNNKRLSAVEGH